MVDVSPTPSQLGLEENSDLGDRGGVYSQKITLRRVLKRDYCKIIIIQD